MKLDEVIERFGDAVDRGLGTLLIGAGLSMGAGYPGWAELLRPYLDEFGLGPDYDNLPEVAQWVVNRDGGNRSRLIDHVVGAFNSIEAQPTSDHRLLAALPIDEMWTTNYDQLLEVAADDRVTIEHDDDYLGESGSRRIHKMHGSIPTGATEPVGGVDGLVLTSHDYDLYEYRWPRTWRLLQAQFLTRTFLVLGFSLTDPNFDAVFRLVRVATPEKHMSHFALLRRDESRVRFSSRCHQARELASRAARPAANTAYLCPASRQRCTMPDTKSRAAPIWPAPTTRASRTAAPSSDSSHAAAALSSVQSRQDARHSTRKQPV